MTASEAEGERVALIQMANASVSKFLEKKPSIQSELDASVAWGVADMKLTKVPVIGGGGGNGVLFIPDNAEKIFFTVKRLDVGGGWGVRAYKALIIFQVPEVLDDWKTGQWVFDAGAEAAAGSSGGSGSDASKDEGFSLHVLSEGGAAVSVTARVIRIKVNDELTQVKEQYGY